MTTERTITHTHRPTVLPQHEGRSIPAHILWPRDSVHRGKHEAIPREKIASVSVSYDHTTKMRTVTYRYAGLTQDEEELIDEILSSQGK